MFRVAPNRFSQKFLYGLERIFSLFGISLSDVFLSPIVNLVYNVHRGEHKLVYRLFSPATTPLQFFNFEVPAGKRWRIFDAYWHYTCDATVASRRFQWGIVKGSLMIFAGYLSMAAGQSGSLGAYRNQMQSSLYNIRFPGENYSRHVSGEIELGPGMAFRLIVEVGQVGDSLEFVALIEEFDE